MDTELEKSKVKHIDITDLLETVRIFVAIFQPFLQIASAISILYRWQYPKLNIFLIFYCYIGCSYLYNVQIVIQLLCMLFFIGIGLMHTRTGLLSKLLPVTTEQLNGGQRSDNVDDITEFKVLLFNLNTLLCRAVKYIHFFYAILKWKSYLKSTIFYVLIATLLLSLNLLPLRFTVGLLLSLILGVKPLIDGLRNNNHYAFMKHVNSTDSLDVTTDYHDLDLKKSDSFNEIENTFEETMDPANLSSTSDSECELSPDEELAELTPSLQVPITPVPSLSQMNGTETYSEDCTSLTSNINTASARMLGRIMEFKKRKQQYPTPVICTMCSVSFSTILRRKRKCSNCANYFCSQCCSDRIPKSLLGVTAPASAAILVPVCVTCHKALTSVPSPQSSSPP